MSSATDTPNDAEDAGSCKNEEFPDPHIPANHRKFNEDFQTGLKHLRSRINDELVRPVAFGPNENTVYVALGEFDLDSMWDEETTDVYMNVPVNFGTGTPYGFVTHPPVNRTDDNSVNRQHRGRADAKPLAEALGVPNNDLSWWSYKWEDMSVNDGSDMTKGIGIIRRRLSEKEDHDA